MYQTVFEAGKRIKSPFIFTLSSPYFRWSLDKSNRTQANLTVPNISAEEANLARERIDVLGEGFELDRRVTD